MNCQILLSEAMTVTFVIIASGAIGWMINIVLSNRNDTGVLKEATNRISHVLERLEIRQEETDKTVSMLQRDFSQLLGEHKTLTDDDHIQHPPVKKKPHGR